MLRLLLILLLVAAAPAAAEEFIFDEAEIEKKIWQLGGYAEARPGLNLLDQHATQTRLRYYGKNADAVLPDLNGKLLLEGSLEKDWAKLFVQTSLEFINSRLNTDLKLSWYEAWLQEIGRAHV